MSKSNAMVDLLGPSILKKVGSKISTVDAFRGKKFVIIYFSASWCPPCQAFTPQLIKFYNKFAKDGKFEVVFVSSDRTVASFDEYYGKMPWLAISTDTAAVEIKSNLAKIFSVSGIPTTIVLEVDGGNYITDNLHPLEDGLKIVQQWNEIDPVPLKDAAATRETAAPKQNMLVSLIFYILKNPMYIFGLLYFYKMGRRYLNNYLTGGAEEDEQVDEAVNDMADATEF
mmetsp:Transcript_22589/g.33361  ORF Transcript_22589/g.33361 Transcript_22589/m.33361 type:complete len:227 (-) Transcript_22589:1395-2075(-)|eukprot:CAMPEP_0194224692 /NCGR_PEP_ID=MMETSP0156-20130528/38001_1 /TAXON_ID=33649 /ORGANISM="Thalassionema nitzschioides, Strain L26-B" /LENGTH=226 /DNA_ID=CAMNT_0038956369 /DNA_START=80 /DNA_END=760 /DNA_ORIENTATION=-